MITKSGKKFKDAIFTLAKRMLDEENFSKNFDDTILNQIWKQKGQKSVLKNNRYIHSKGWLQRTVEAMVVMEMKSPILLASTPYHIGGQEGNRSQQHLFTVRSVMAIYHQLGKMLYQDERITRGQILNLYISTILMIG